MADFKSLRRKSKMIIISQNKKKTKKKKTSVQYTPRVETLVFTSKYTQKRCALYIYTFFVLCTSLCSRYMHVNAF